VGVDEHERSVPARNHQRQQRIARRVSQRAVRLVEERPVDVADEVVDSDIGDAVPEGQPFRERKPHQQRGDQPRPLRHRDRVDVAEGDVRFGKRAVEHRCERGQVFARRQLRNHAAVRRVFGDLRGDAARQYFVSIPDDGRGGFVAARFNSQNQSHFEKNLRAT